MLADNFVSVLADRLGSWRARRAASQSEHAPQIGLPLPAPLRSRPQQWRFLGFALGVFLAAAVHPVTGWIFSRQAQLLASGESLRGIHALNTLNPLFSEHADAQKRLEQEAALSRQEVGEQTADALLQGLAMMPGSSVSGESMLTLWGQVPADKIARLQRMRQMMQRFPGSPIPCAAYLSYAASKEALGSRQERDWYREAIQQGQRLDPGNAYFSFMQIRADYADHDPNAALRDLDAAAQKPVWNDYSQPIIQGAWRLNDAYSGANSSQLRLAILEDVRIQYFGINNSGAGNLMLLAWKQERAGNIAGSVAIRGRMLRLALKVRGEWPAMLLQAQARNYLLEACLQDPYVRAGARSPRSAEPLKNYIAYLRLHGYAAEAQWLEAQSKPLAGRDEIRSNYWMVSAYTFNEAGTPLKDAVRPVSMPRWYWAAAGVCILITLSWVILVGVAAGSLNFAGRFLTRRPRPLSGSVVCGIGAGLLLAACTLYGLYYTMMTSVASGLDKLPLLCLIGLPPVVIALMRETQVTSRALLLTYCGTCAVVLGMFLPLGSAALTAERLLDRRALLLGMQFVSLRALLDGALQLTLWLLTAPLLALLGGMVMSRWRRVPAGWGVWRGLSALILPLLSLLLLFYTGTLLATARAEAQSDRMLLDMLKNEPQIRAQVVRDAERNERQSTLMRGARILSGDLHALDVDDPIPHMR